MSWIHRAVYRLIILKSRILLFVTLLVLANITPATADDVTQFEVNEDAGIYSIKARVLLDAPADYVRTVLTDFVHIYRLNPSIVESEILASPDKNTTHVRTKVLGCVSAYCEEFDRVERVRILESGDILAEVIPEASRFKTGITLWKIKSTGDRTLLSYEAEIEPDFFIPPVIGSLLLKARLREEITTSFTRLEKIASIQSERDWNPEHQLPNMLLAKSTMPCE